MGIGSDLSYVCVWPTATAHSKFGPYRRKHDNYVERVPLGNNTSRFHLGKRIVWLVMADATLTKRDGRIA